MDSHFCSLLLPSSSHAKSAPLSTPFIGAKTPQEDECSRLDTPELLQQQCSAGKVLKTQESAQRKGIRFTLIPVFYRSSSGSSS